MMTAARPARAQIGGKMVMATKKPRRLCRRVSSLVVALFVAAPLAVAQGSETSTSAPSDVPAAQPDLANNTAFGDWVVKCEAASARRTVCTLVQEQALRDSGAVLVRFIAAPLEDGAILLAQTPMGTYLPGGAVYRIAGRDDVEQREMVWQRCLGSICEAAAPLDADEIGLFADAEALLFGYRMTADGDPIVLRVDISRFSKGLEALRAATATQ